MAIAKNDSGDASPNAAPASSEFRPAPETISAMLEARAIHLYRFTSPKELFNKLDEAAQQNRVIKTLA